MTQAMSHFQHEEHQCIICVVTGHFARDCPHLDTFCMWHKEHLNSQGAGPDDKTVPTLKDHISSSVDGNHMSLLLAR